MIVAIEPLTDTSSGDFLSFYYAARAIHQHLDLYDPSTLINLSRADGLTTQVYPYLYPPVLAQLLQPLAALPINIARGVWLGILLLAVAVSSIPVLVTTVPAATDTHETRSRFVNRLLLTLICTTLIPVRNNLAMGQVNLLVVALLALTVASYFTHRPLLAGTFLAVATLIKATPIVFVGFFLARRAFKVVKALIVASVLIIAMSLGFGGVIPWRQYLSHAPSYGFTRDIPGLFPAAITFNFSPLGALSRVAPRELAASTAIGISICALLIALVLAVRARDKYQERTSLSLFPIAMLFASPLTYLHHVAYLAISAIVWLPVIIKRRHWTTLAAVVLVLGIAGIDWPALYDRLGPLFGRQEYQAINLYAIVVLYGMIIVEYQRRDQVLGS
ncbi:MAG: glycosyltransferase family 87 protein [Pseudomonadota bacterium]